MGMRPLQALGLLVAVLLAHAGCGGKKHDKARFVVEVSVTENVQVTVGGRTIPLEPVSGAGTGLPGGLRGMLDVPESEIPSTTPPVVTLMTPCGPKEMELPKDAVAPPNESNVTVVRLVDAHFHGLKTTFLFAPGIREPVKIGDIAVAQPPPERMTVFYAACGKPLTVGGESTPIDDSPVIVVASAPSACLKSGVALYGTLQPPCVAESGTVHTGKIAYPLRAVPDFLFKFGDRQVEVSRASAVKCSNRTWLQVCD
jgi:hypothetical protein